MLQHRLLLLCRLCCACAALLLAACGSVKYTVDDGRPVDATLLANIRQLGEGERVLRPAIWRTRQLADQECSRQWELPFSVASSYDLKEDERVAWVRALQVDERLTVVSAIPESGLENGDKLVALDGYERQDSAKMLEKLQDLRDAGRPFPVRTARGRTLTVTPFSICRGYARLAPVNDPRLQDYHWLASVHPLDIFTPRLTPDEALWIVLWTQGLSEEGGARMKTFHYSKKFVLTLIDIATFAVGLNGAAQAAKVAADQAMTSAANAATRAASEQAARQLLENAAKNAAESAAKEYAQRVGEEVGKNVGKQVGSAVTESFVARAGFSVSSLSWVASTVFDQADAWAFERMRRLDANPVAGATLHRKLVERGLLNNAFALDDERMGSLAIAARQSQHEAMLLAAIRGASLESFALQLVDMPSASHPESLFEMTSASEAALPAGPLPAEQAMPADSDKI